MTGRVLRFSKIGLDLLTLLAAYTIAFAVRFDASIPADFIGRLLLTAPYVIVGEYAVLAALGVPRLSWRYVSFRDVARIGVGVGLFTVGLAVIRFALEAFTDEYLYLRHGLIPWGVIATNALLAFVFITGARGARRMQGERADSHRASRVPEKRVRTMLVGAGQAGMLVTRELSARRELGMDAVGFLDDDDDKVGTIVGGVPVLGHTDDLGELCAKHGAEQVLITMASAPGSAVRRIAKLAEDAGLAVKIIPGLYEIVGGRVNLSRIRPVAIDDLLRRDAVELDTVAIGEAVRGRVVLVTGAGGSIGSELCRQLARFEPKELILVERAENALFQIHRELGEEHRGLAITPLIADVTDEPRMRGIFELKRPATVFHAAAHKHVPMMEFNPVEAVKNNVFGTRTVAELAHAFDTESFVLVSTDKAVNPTSVMGATKRIAEIVVQNLAAQSDTRFVTVRFGNVLGSAGSVIPIFKEQIARGGPVTVTDPEMRRYFMTIPEACQLVMQAGTMGEGGEIFILDMGEPVRIVDLARDLIRLSGLRPDDIEIVFTGLRPGEKLFEELSASEEHATKTRHPKILVGKSRTLSSETVAGYLRSLTRAVGSYDARALLGAVLAAVPEFTSTNPAAPHAPSVTRPDGPRMALDRADDDRAGLTPRALASPAK